MYKKTGEVKWNNPDRDIMTVLPIAVRAALIKMEDPSGDTRGKFDGDGGNIAELLSAGKALGKFFALHGKGCPNRPAKAEDIVRVAGLLELDDKAIDAVRKEVVHYLFNLYTTWSLVADGAIKENQVSEVVEEFMYRGSRIVGFHVVLIALKAWAKGLIRRIFCRKSEATEGR